jgi:hypothetical protein
MIDDRGRRTHDTCACTCWHCVVGPAVDRAIVPGQRVAVDVTHLLDPLPGSGPVTADTDRMTCAEALNLAKWWAATKGIHAFPIAISWDDRKQATNKRPLTDHGHLDGTTDPAELERLFNAKSPRPGEVWGVGLWPGPSGHLVLDPDIKNGEHGDDELAALEAEHGKLDTMRGVTASGGGQVWLKKPAGVHIGNADLAPGVNVRSDDGGLVAIGTHTPWGSWDHDEATPRTPIDSPGWLLDRLTSSAGSGGGKGRWAPLDRSKLHSADLACLEAAERLGGHDAYVGGDGYVMIVSPHKTAGGSASIGHIGPGVMKVFTDGWEPLQQNGVYDVDQLTALANPDTSNDLLAGLRNGAWLDAQEFPALRYHLPGIVPEGSSLLVGPPKIGKSWLVLSLALAAAAGGQALGQPIDARPVFYLALEDGGPAATGPLPHPPRHRPDPAGVRVQDHRPTRDDRPDDRSVACPASRRRPTRHPRHARQSHATSLTRRIVLRP